MSTLTEEVVLSDPSVSREFKLRPGSEILTIGAKLLDGFGHLLKRPWLLIITGLAGTSLLASAFWLPQLSDQINSDSSAATRWLLGASAEYGAWGSLLRTLGLFNVLHSTLLQLLLAIIALILCAHFADLLTAAWCFYRLKSMVSASVEQAGTPLALSFSQWTYRDRQAVAIGPEQAQSQLLSELNNHFGAEQVTSFYLDTGVPESQEWRLLAFRHTLAVYLRPWLILGLLLALVTVWQIVVASWEVTPPLLAPGDVFRYYPRNLEVKYEVQEDGITPQLVAKVGNAQAQQEIQAAVALQLGSAKAQVQPGPPAMRVRTNLPEAALERAGQSSRAASLGLIFPTIGSEESIVLQKQAVGLRIVRVAPTTAEGDTAAFLVEVYRGKDLQPQRLDMSKEQRKSIQIDKEVTVELTLLPSLAVVVRYLPGMWLSWLALLCIVVGAVGFWLRPAFLLVQISPWPTQRAVVVMQSNLQPELDRIQELLTPNHETDLAASIAKRIE